LGEEHYTPATIITHLTVCFYFHYCYADSLLHVKLLKSEVVKSSNVL